MLEALCELCRPVRLPQMARVRQIFPEEHIPENEIADIVRAELSRPVIAERIKPGMRVAVTCGSRGIANIAPITRAIVDFVKAAGASPFVFPAMGSHGNACAEGQMEVLTSYGVTEDYLRCPVLCSMEVSRVGSTDEGHAVMIDKYAAEADAIIVAGRIKPHPAFSGPYGSGLMKMMAIGMGKQQGAEVCHAAGFGQMHRLVPAFGNVILKNTPVVCGVGIIENALDQTKKITALTPEEIVSEEPALLKEAIANMPRIYIEEADVLVIDEMGKDISGDGNDPYVSGTFCTPYASGGIKAQRVVVLDLTEASHGNAAGVGMADIITQRLCDKIDREKTYINALTSTMLNTARTPVTAPTDETAVKLAVRTCYNLGTDGPRIVRIKNTLHLREICVSANMLDDAEAHPQLEVQSGAVPLLFDENGALSPMDSTQPHY